MDKDGLLRLIEEARKRAESGDLDIAAQHEIITVLEQKGLDSTTARTILAKLVAAQEVDLTEMERLLDEMGQSREERGLVHDFGRLILLTMQLLVDAADVRAPQYICDLPFGGFYGLLFHAREGHMQGLVNECRQPFPGFLTLLYLDDALVQEDTADGALTLQLALHDPDLAGHVISRRPSGVNADTTPCSSASGSWPA